MTSDVNQQVYGDPQIVRHYAQLQRLQTAEQRILEQLQPQLATMRMLDLGVGGGRTTEHFAPLVAEYVGLDYSASMIAACQARFPHCSEKYSFVVGDVRDLSCFEDNYFDFIFFSFNGLDYIEHHDRLLALQEIYRVGKPGGYFVFSSHNLQGIEPLFRWRDRLSWNPIQSHIETIMWAFLRGFNRSITPNSLARSDYAIIKDEPHNFRLANYYIRPGFQRQQLAPYFEQIQIYDWQTGLEIKDDLQLKKNRKLWLYYCCIIRAFEAPTYNKITNSSFR